MAIRRVGRQYIVGKPFKLWTVYHIPASSPLDQPAESLTGDSNQFIGGEPTYIQLTRIVSTYTCPNCYWEQELWNVEGAALVSNSLHAHGK